MIGNEWNKRLLLIELVEGIQQFLNGNQILEKYGYFNKKAIKKTTSIITICEKELAINFTDEKHNLLPFIFACILRRINNNKILDCGIDLSDEQVYKTISNILDVRNGLLKQELSFLSLLILTSNVSIYSGLDRRRKPALISGLRLMISNFEQLSCIEFQERDELHDKLYVHLLPAYYRIKYGLVQNNLSKKNYSKIFLSEHKELHHLVKKSLLPLEQIIGLSIPEIESIYFTMLIGGWLVKQNDPFEYRIKALVVCPNGISVSKMMRSSLKDLFPEFVFLDALSVREFGTYDLDHDIVFSPVYLETNKKLFIVEPLLDWKEKERLKNQVFQVLYGYTPYENNMESVIEIIGKHADIYDYSALRRELNQHFSHGKEIETLSINENKPNLRDLLQVEHIRIKRKVNSWKEAIELASQPLLENGIITKEYIKKMIKIHDVEKPYVIYGSDPR